MISIKQDHYHFGWRINLIGVEYFLSGVDLMNCRFETFKRFMKKDTSYLSERDVLDLIQAVKGYFPKKTRPRIW